MLRTVRLAGAALIAAALLPTTPALAAGHLVAPGETLWGIASANGLSASALAAANGLSSEARVIAGTSLTIPALGTGISTSAPATTPATSSSSGGGLVVPLGDTLSGIAARNGVSLSRLAAANGLDPSRPLLAGTRLHLPASGGAGASAVPVSTTSGSGSAAPAPLGGYTVRPGDTLATGTPSPQCTGETLAHATITVGPGGTLRIQIQITDVPAHDAVGGTCTVSATEQAAATVPCNRLEVITGSYQQPL